MRISEATRRDIFDSILIEGVIWSGRLEETEFLSRIFDLKSLPSTDGRFTDAEGDIWQHRINNCDWEDDWIFYDSRFNLLGADDEIFLKFLCEMLHPAVRPDTDEVTKMMYAFNESLRTEGVELVQGKKIAGRPVIIARGLVPSRAIDGDFVLEAFAKADSEYIAQQIARMENAINDDPALAIGTAKELVETCCKTILHDLGVDFDSNLDLSQLAKKTAKELSLTPEDIPEQAKAAQTIRRILGNLASITQGMAEIRNLYGTGHGKHAASKGLQPRHARLAVGAASTLAVFLLETRQSRQDSVK